MRPILVLLILAVTASGQISYADFSSVAGLVMNGGAGQSGTVLQLTGGSNWQKGSAWSAQPLAVAQGFDMVFRFRIQPTWFAGGDGMALVIHNDPRGNQALGDYGHALGYGVFPSAVAGTAIANSLVVEFDTRQTTFPGVSDSSDNEVSIHTNGSAANGQDESFSLGSATPADDLNDGQPHLARVRFTPPLLEVFVDDLGTPLLTVPYDFQAGGVHQASGTPVAGLSLLPGGTAWVGFTAASGTWAESHEVQLWQTPPFEFQLNSPVAGLSVDGRPDPGPLEAISHAGFVNELATLNLRSINVGQPWDLAVRIPGQAIGLSAGGTATPSGRTINLDPSPTGLYFLGGGALPNLQASAFPAVSLDLPVTFANPLALAAQMIVLDPGSPAGYDLSHAVELSFATCPAQQDFDGLLPGQQFPAGWGSAGGSIAWRVGSGTTGNTGTGPLAGAFSPPNYMFCSTVGFGSGGIFRMKTCAIDVGSLSSFTLEFRLSRLGASIGTLNVKQDDGTGTFPILLGTWQGANPSGADWTLESLPFLPATPTLVETFLFEYVAAGSAGDLAIDDFVLL